MHLYMYTSPMELVIENYHLCVGQNKRLPWEKKNKGINYNLKPFLSCSSESIALQLGDFVLHKRLTEKHLSACFTMKTKLVYTPKFTF